MQVTSVYQGPFALGVSGAVVTVLLIGHYGDTRTTNLYLGRGGVRSVYSAEARVLPVPLLALETLDIRAASLPPASLLGQGLHLRHATARDRTRRRALLVDLSPAASAGRPPMALRCALGLWAVALLSAGRFFFLVVAFKMSSPASLQT